jgi:acetolactate synthase-1/3 small subunit
MMKEEQDYILTMLVSNKPSVTSRITGLFSGRGYNMQSICGAPTHDPNISRITIKTKANPDTLIEIQAQLNRLIDVVKLRDMTHEGKAVKREMALISVEASPEQQKELIALASPLNAQTLNEGADSIIFEITGTEDDVDILIEKLRPFGIRKVARSGVLALYRDLEKEFFR